MSLRDTKCYFCQRPMQVEATDEMLALMPTLLERALCNTCSDRRNGVPFRRPSEPKQTNLPYKD